MSIGGTPVVLQACVLSFLDLKSHGRVACADSVLRDVARHGLASPRIVSCRGIPVTPLGGGDGGGDSGDSVTNLRRARLIERSARFRYAPYDVVADDGTARDYGAISVYVPPSPFAPYKGSASYADSLPRRLPSRCSLWHMAPHTLDLCHIALACDELHRVVRALFGVRRLYIDTRNIPNAAAVALASLRQLTDVHLYATAPQSAPDDLECLTQITALSFSLTPAMVRHTTVAGSSPLLPSGLERLCLTYTAAFIGQLDWVRLFSCVPGLTHLVAPYLSGIQYESRLLRLLPNLRVLDVNLIADGDGDHAATHEPTAPLSAPSRIESLSLRPSFGSERLAVWYVNPLTLRTLLFHLRSESAGVETDLGPGLLLTCRLLRRLEIIGVRHELSASWLRDVCRELSLLEILCLSGHYDEYGSGAGIRIEHRDALSPLSGLVHLRRLGFPGIANLHRMRWPSLPQVTECDLTHTTVRARQIVASMPNLVRLDASCNVRLGMRAFFVDSTDIGAAARMSHLSRLRFRSDPANRGDVDLIREFAAERRRVIQQGLLKSHAAVEIDAAWCRDPIGDSEPSVVVRVSEQRLTRCVCTHLTETPCWTSAHIPPTRQSVKLPSHIAGAVGIALLIVPGHFLAVPWHVLILSLAILMVAWCAR